MRKLAAITLAAALTLPAAAVVTPAGTFYLKLSGTTAAQDPQLAGTAIRDDLVPFTVAGGATGTIQVRTVRRATGQLSFYWKINVAANAPGSVAIAHIGGFPEHAYEADWRPDGLGTVAPAGIGGQVTSVTKKFGMYFQFGKPVGPGESSRFFYVKTTATQAGKGYVVLGGSASGLSSQIASDAPLF